MEKQTEREELNKVLDRLKKEELEEQKKQRRNNNRAETRSGNGKKDAGDLKKQRSGSKTAGTKKPQQTGWKQELTTGLSAMIIDTVLLFVGVYLFALLYKSFVTYELTTGQDVTASVTFYVSPVTGMLGIVLLFILKNVYDFRFYRIQKQAKEWRQHMKRAGEWILYIVFMLLYELFAFINFSCGLDFFDTYTFQNALLGNIAYTVLYLVAPLLYPIQACVRLIFHLMDKQRD